MEYGRFKHSSGDGRDQFAIWAKRSDSAGDIEWALRQQLFARGLGPQGSFVDRG
jgi:hypothetical protein